MNSSRKTKTTAAMVITIVIASPPASVRPQDRRNMRSPSLASSAKPSSHGRPHAARHDSRSCVTPPNCTRAARRASSTVSPRRRPSSSAISRWAAISWSKSDSRSPGRRNPRMRAAIVWKNASTTQFPVCGCNTRPITPATRSQFCGLGLQLLPAGLRQGIELGLAVVVGHAPLCLDPFLLNQADQAQVDGPLVHDQGAFPDLLDATERSRSRAAARGAPTF